MQKILFYTCHIKYFIYSDIVSPTFPRLTQNSLFSIFSNAIRSPELIGKNDREYI